ncbi:Protein very KIND [Channa argus]|uniref:Protein very KIND n=1 Tax=Channa argus TaxID=215402 RepID=A0A6G1R1N2_CHAAH|nr:Protein very KIND [Channa argus]
METSGSDAGFTYLGKAEERDGYNDLEHLPPLLEDEENVSLADILSLRDSCLSEEEVWAVCAECAVALQSIRPSHLFHTLCITPDTLAFNAHGNVCFMEQLSDLYRFHFANYCLKPYRCLTGSDWHRQRLFPSCAVGRHDSPSSHHHPGGNCVTHYDCLFLPLFIARFTVLQLCLSSTSYNVLTFFTPSSCLFELSTSLGGEEEDRGGKRIAKESEKKVKDRKDQIEKKGQSKQYTVCLYGLVLIWVHCTCSQSEHWLFQKMIQKAPLSLLSLTALAARLSTVKCAKGVKTAACKQCNCTGMFQKTAGKQCSVGHVYSLGSTLSAALNFVIEPELEAELGEEVQKLLEQMQEEKPEDRPLLQDILSLAEAQLSHTSSAAVCRKLSSIGRRVLSIESVSAFPDGLECAWEVRWHHPKPRCLLKSSDDSTKDLCCDSPVKANGLSRQQVCGAWDSSLWAEEMDSGDDGVIFADEMDFRSHNSSPVRRRAQQRLNRVRGALNRSCSVPDSNNPPSLPPPAHGDISVPVSDLTEIGADEHLSSSSVWSNRFPRLNRGRSCESYPHSGTEDYVNPFVDGQSTHENKDPAEALWIEEGMTQECHDTEPKDCVEHLASSPVSYQGMEREHDSSVDQSSLNHSLYMANNHMTKSMLCLNEESQDEWISLRQLLTRCGRRLTVNELWALCYTCLSSLQTYIDFPGSRDDFFLAPEYQEHGIVTEKVCVYGVAAILWATAKFSLSPNQKLAMPRKLKRLLLEMAKRTPIERPTIVVAKKVLVSLPGFAFSPVLSRMFMTKPFYPALIAHSLDSAHYCFPMHKVPAICNSLRQWPEIDPSYPVNKELNLPEAFTSTSTHFTPIILTNEKDSEEESHSTGAITEGTLDEFTNTHEFPSPFESTYLYHARTEPNLNRQELPVNQAGGAKTSTTPSENMLIDTSILPNISGLQVSLSQPISSNLSGCGVFNNYLFHQDPTTGHLSLVPVQVRAPDSALGLDINLALIPQPLQGLIPDPESTDGPFIKCLNVPVRPGRQYYSPPSSFFNGSSVISDRPLENSVPRAYNGQTNHKGTQRDIQSPSESISPKVLPALQEVIHLLKGEFSLKGCLHNGHEDIAMGEYIFSLKDIQYPTFARVVKERFSDLFWEDDLLGVLHCLVNYSPSTLTPCSRSNEQPPSEAVKRAALTPTLMSTVCSERKEEDFLHSHLDLNGNVHMSGPASHMDSWEGTKAQSHQGKNEIALEDCELTSNQSQHCVSQGAASVERVLHVDLACVFTPNALPATTLLFYPGLGSAPRSPLVTGWGHTWWGGIRARCLLHPNPRGVSTDSSDGGVMEGGDRSAGGSDQSPSEAEFPSGREEGLMGANEEQMSPDFSEDMEDSESMASEQLLSLGSRAGGLGLSFSPAWALAFFGEDCFSPEVIQYAVNLGQHIELPCLDVKAQELQQQLIIETRNLKKTRNFHQKLILQEKKNKGWMPISLCSVLSVEQWGLELSLLPSLATCGQGFLDLQSTENPSGLSFGTSKGKRTLQAGSPLGLMAYLYARNAAVEGYIQQFLYTYRFFCTPEQLLQFIMDQFISAAREGSEMSRDREKIVHRSLDLLHFWITDCKPMDFTPKSSLVDTLENFLNAEVIPVDSRGEALLSSLHSPPNTIWSRGRGSLISLEENEDSVCLHSGTGDLERKWRISSVVEPSASVAKDKAFSIAAALPVPCYGSLVGDLSNACLHSVERLPFSQSEYGAQHIAQQLTLLQQEIFQGCHPVHFLNSRVQGVRDKVLSPNKNVSHHYIPPAEGSSQLEGTPSGGHLQQLLTYADSVTNWISAEIVICDSVKTQAALLTKYLWIGKHCYESRNFATAMQVLRGLENVIVRQLPAWKHLSSKVCEILEELRAVQVFLKSDDLCLMGGQHSRRRPTLPSVHILAMHVQQLEIGAFTLTTGAYKWTKLRSIAKAVSQVHAFQEAAYSYRPDRELQAYIRRRVARLAATDIHLLAADNDASVQQSSERQTRRIQNTLRRVKATFLKNPSPVSTAAGVGQTKDLQAELRKWSQREGDVPGAVDCYPTGAGRTFKAAEIKGPKRPQGFPRPEREITDEGDNEAQPLICIVL